MSASEVIVTLFLALSLVLYVITGGADFGVGIVEWLAPASERPALRRAGERAIAPIWEANHIWIIVALVILFVAFPAVHVRLTTILHVPLVIMLVGIVLRGTAFTFRYYDVGDDEDGERGRVWSWLFRGGSVLVPWIFGHLAAAMSRGQIPQRPSDVWESYFAPWIGAFPAACGVFTVVLFGWLAAVFLAGEASDDARPSWATRARGFTIAMVASGAMVSAAAWFEDVPWFGALAERPALWAIVAVATTSVVVVFRLVDTDRVWTVRAASGVTIAAILGGYFGAVYPVALEIRGHAPLTWHDGRAPESALDALALALLAGSILILPGLFWLYRVFKRPA